MKKNGSRKKGKGSRSRRTGNPMEPTTTADATRIYVDFVHGKRGAIIPCIDNYMFYAKDSVRSRFKCKDARCKETIFVKTDEHGRAYVERRPVHDHPDHSYCIKNARHIHRLRSDILDDKNKHVPTRVVTEAVRTVSATDRRRSVDMRLARNTRTRMKQPQTAKEIELGPEIRENVVFVSDGNDVIVFARRWGIDAMTNAQRICVDGTFRTAPKTHTQLLSFHVLCSNGTALPVAHALTKNMTSTTYSTILSMLQEAARATGRVVFGRKDLVVTVDFEQAMITALKETGTRIHGCYFHYCQAIWRFVKMHGMSRRYNTGGEFRAFVRSLMSLVFFKPGDIPRRFRGLRSSVGDDDDLKRVCEYYERTWIRGYGVDIICQHNEIFRTNNHAEAFHNGIKSMINKTRPEFFDFVEKLVLVMDFSEAKYLVERLNPKRMSQTLSGTTRQISELINNFYNDPVLRLPVETLLSQIGEIVNEKLHFEQSYATDDIPAVEDVAPWLGDGVPMEIEEIENE